MSNDFRRYVPGTFFKIKTGSSKILYQYSAEMGDGIWIGWFNLYIHV